MDCADRMEAARRRARESADANRRACDDLVNQRISERRSAELECARDGRVSVCIDLQPQALSKLCMQRCFAARDGAVRAEVAQARSACEQEYIESKGKGIHECRVNGALDEHEAEAGALEQRVRDELERAIKARDGAALDKALLEAEALDRLRLREKCTIACRTRGPELFSASARAPALIAAYKRCMVAADSTHEARKLAAYERDLYCAYLSRANRACRAANRCDWVESLVDAQCTYASPGIGDCDRAE